VKRFEILDRDLSLENGELTPTGKIRRRAVHEHFADLIDTLYEGVTAELDDLT
jgi:long-chain acyl-CoA synthetase